ncbi:MULTISPECIES: hypothetical protein [Streptacidiphilus]|uniref:RiboL-PSP-HEPN domain-containing protein n=1 Tax=Streptacidiphilus cavernicola TaxID=3342716 RepID=A0ABV6UQ34_9ACTN|nr:hypothetical protein [Streptacidiphilus jeojiense]
MGSEETPTEATTGSEIHISDEMTVTLVRWNSISNARSAVLMARRCEEREQARAGLTDGTSEAETAADEHWAFASSSVVASVMFLEANINEVFLSAIRATEQEGRPNFYGAGFPYVGGLLASEDRRRLAALWDLLKGATGLLEKYQFTLNLLGKEPMNTGHAPYQPVKRLVEARNKLIHFKEGAHEVGRDLRSFEKGLHESLGGTSFRPHPFTSAGNSFYPDQFFGYAGCRWAWKAADSFAQEFHRQLGVDPAYQASRASLTLP